MSEITIRLGSTSTVSLQKYILELLFGNQLYQV